MVKNRIRELREENNLTLKGLSNKLKSEGYSLSASSLIKYERGERNPSLETWQKLSDFFNVPVAYLQGQGLSVTQAKDKIINILHDGYFTGQLDQVVNGYLKTTQVNTTPFDFYPEDEDGYEMKASIKNFWMQHFNYIFSSPAITDVVVNFKLYDEDEIIERLKNVIEDETLKQLPNNSPIKIFDKKYSKRLLKADLNLNSAIRFGDKDDIKEAIVSYENILEDLKHDFLL